MRRLAVLGVGVQVLSFGFLESPKLGSEFRLEIWSAGHEARCLGLGTLSDFVVEAQNRVARPTRIP